MLAARRNLIAFPVVFVVVLVVVPLVLPEYRLVTAANAGLYALFALGLCATFSYCGQFSLAQGVFGTVGGFLAGSLSVHASVPLWAGTLIGVVAAGAVSALLGLFMFRLRGFYFAIGTLLLSTIVTLLVTNQLDRWTGSESGLSLGDASLAGISLTDPYQFYLLVWVCVGVFALGFANLERSRVIRAARAVKGSERAAELSGLSVRRVKIGMFVLNAVLAGLAGALLAGSTQYITPDTFDINLSVLIFVGVVIGGRNSFWGALIGAVVVIVLGEVLNGLAESATLVYGVIYVAVLLVLPGGLSSLPSVIARRRAQAGPTATARSGVPDHVPAPELIRAAGAARRASPASGPLLEVRGLRVAFGEVESVRGVDFSLERGTLLALLGPNGAGKTTVLNAISGLVEPSSGTIAFEGRDITRSPIHERRRRGIARTLQSPYIIGDLAIWENIALGCDFEHRHGIVGSATSWPRARRAERAIAAHARALADQVGLAGAADWQGTALSFGQRRLIELARALAGSSSLLLLDEPFAGLSPEMVAHVKRLLRRLVDDGGSIIIIDHNLEHVTEIADEGLFLLDGEVAQRGKVAAIADRLNLSTPAVTG